VRFFIGKTATCMFIAEAESQNKLKDYFGYDATYKEISFSQYKKHIEEFEGELKIKMEIKNV